MLESSLQSENITYRPHAARGCVKLQSKHIRNTYDRYTTIIIIIIYENCTVRLAIIIIIIITSRMRCIVGRA